MRKTYEELVSTCQKVLMKYGMKEESAKEAAENVAQSTLDGIYSHGILRFPRIVDYIKRGLIKVEEEITLVDAFGAIERYDGHLGMGNLQARKAMERACVLAKEYGIGLVALRNTNHWLRGGAFGWQAAEKGFMAMLWTNTMPNMPPHGGEKSTLGNNPVIMAVPRKNGAHLVVDMALSQFSYGKMEALGKEGKELPVPGGYDLSGELTKDPLKVMESRRVLPIGFWKGSSFSLMLDLFAGILSGGHTVSDISSHGKDETGVSQVFIAMDPRKYSSEETMEELITRVLAFTKGEGGVVYYPGEQTLKRRQEHLRQGIPITEDLWRIIEHL